MKNKLLAFWLLVMSLLIANQLVTAQKPKTNQPNAFFCYPEITEKVLPEAWAKLDLPSSVDNSQNQYFRPIFSQIGASCGQASSVAYHFTYEMCRERDVPANIESNQFPSHFTYNFMGYDGYYGVNYLHSMEMCKQVGNPDLATYGGLAIDEGIVWISGYDKYYNAMQNRIHQIHMIRTGTEEGLLNLKHWLAHHHEGASVGGVANFASGSPYGMVGIPPGLPEAGKQLILAFPGHVAVHAMTIVGYNDSIRYDVNGDGQFTNHLDINDDGKIDLRDWEIGAFKVANSYGSDWGDDGFFHMLYRVMALNEYDGGIWGSMVHVMDVTENYQPQIAIKVMLKHNLREQIRVVAGISATANAQYPEHLMYFPVFNYQGGKHFMQGGTTVEANKTIEFGLDISPLLSYIEPGSQSTFFLEIHENDPLSSGEGEVVQFSLMDYSAGDLLEIQCPQQSVNLTNNDITRLSIVHSPNFEPVEILTEQIPIFDASFSFQAEGGEEPYSWQLKSPYHQQMIDKPMPQIDQQQLLMEAPYDKYATKALGFSFPFFGENFDTVYVNEAGFVLFEPDIFPWRYNRDSYHLFREMKHISAFLFAPVMFYEGTKQPDGIWFEGDETHASFRWKKDLFYYDNQIGSGEFALSLYPDGKIDFYYNDIQMDENILWYAGVSAGNNLDYTLLQAANTRNFFVNRSFSLIPELLPEGLDLSNDGVLIALPGQMENIANLFIQVTDARQISDTKQFQFSQDIRFECNYNTASGLPPSNGSSVAVDLQIINSSQQEISNLEILFSLHDPEVILLDSLATLSILPANGSVLLTSAFAFSVDQSCPDGHALLPEIIINSSIGQRIGKSVLKIKSCNLALDSWLVDDNDNNLLDPGEETEVVFLITNSGSLAASQVSVHLTTNDPYLSILPASALEIGNIEPYSSAQAVYDINVNAACPIDHKAIVTLEITDSQGVEIFEEIEMTIGQFQVLVIKKTTDGNSSDAIMMALDSLGLTYDYTENIDASIFKYRALMLCQGTYGNIVYLTTSEQEMLKDYLDQGGNIYREAFYNWTGSGFFPTYFSTLQENLPNPQNITSLTGVSNTVFEGFESDFTGPVPFMFIKLVPRTSMAFPVLHSDLGTTAYTAIANVQVNYKTIASLYEFGYTGQIGDVAKRELLMQKILTFFNMEHLIVNSMETYPDQDGNIAIKAIPNPFADDLMIELSLLPDEDFTLELISLNGKCLKKWHFDKASANQSVRNVRMSASFFPSDLPKGVYLLRLNTRQSSFGIKVVKN